MQYPGSRALDHQQRQCYVKTRHINISFNQINTVHCFCISPTFIATLLKLNLASFHPMFSRANMECRKEYDPLDNSPSRQTLLSPDELCDALPQERKKAAFPVWTLHAFYIAIISCLFTIFLYQRSFRSLTYCVEEENTWCG